MGVKKTTKYWSSGGLLFYNVSSSVADRNLVGREIAAGRRALRSRKKIEKVLAAHGRDRGELIPILQELQGALGYLPPEALEAVARHLGLTPTQVYSVVTFYSQFHLTPRGRYIINVCQGTACHVRGGKRVLHAVRRRLGIDIGQTSEDYKFSLERVACVGSCALAPVMVINGQVYGRMTPREAERILEKLP